MLSNDQTGLNPTHSLLQIMRIYSIGHKKLTETSRKDLKFQFPISQFLTWALCEQFFVSNDDILYMLHPILYILQKQRKLFQLWVLNLKTFRVG
jgi:hypothetical protein